MTVDDSHQRTALGVVIAFPVLGGVAIILRYWSRFLSRTSFAGDDLFITAGYVLAVVQSVTSWFYIKTNYVGIHSWDIPADRDVKKGLIWNFVNQLVYNPCLTLIKISILLFLRRLDSKSRVVNGLIWATLGITIGLFLAVLFVDIFQCSPIAYVYDTSIEGGTCIDQGAFYVTTAALNLFTDVLVLSVPIIITWSLQMPVRRKIAVCIILCFGGVATAIGIWRIIILAQAFFPTHVNTDPTWDIGFCSSAIEVNVAVMAACAPSTKAILGKYLPRLLGTSKGASSKYGATNSWSRRFQSGVGYSRTKSARGADDGFELADPYQVKMDVISADREMRNYTRHGESPSLSSDEGVAGIVQTIDVSVRYNTREEENSVSHSREGKTGSIDSLV